MHGIYNAKFEKASQASGTYTNGEYLYQREVSHTNIHLKYMNRLNRFLKHFSHLWGCFYLNVGEYILWILAK